MTIDLDWKTITEILPNEGDTIEVKGPGILGKCTFENRKFMADGRDVTVLISHWRYGITTES